MHSVKLLLKVHVKGPYADIICRVGMPHYNIFMALDDIDAY